MNDEMTDLNSDNIERTKNWVLISEASYFTIANARVLGRLALIPFVVCVAVFIIEKSLPNATWIYLMSLIVKFCAMGMFAVAVHRFYILGETPKIRLGTQEIKFTLFAILTAALWVVPLEFSVFVFDQHVEALHNNERPNPISFLGAFVCVCILYFAVLRLSLVFPLIAISWPGSLISQIGYSWHKMCGNVLTFFVSATILSIVFALFTSLSNLVLGLIFGEESGIHALVLIVETVNLCTGFLYSLFLVLFVSYIFKKTRPVGLI